MDLVQTSLAREPAEINVVKKSPSLETICEDINRILTPTLEQPIAETPMLNSENKSEAIPDSEVLGSKSLPTPHDDCKPDSSADDEGKDMVIEPDPIKESCSSMVNEKNETPSLPEEKENNTEVDEANDAGLNENIENSDAGVILLDD